MQIGCFQFKPELNNTGHNVNKIIETANSAEVDVLIFPELSVSGYFFRNRNESTAAGREYLDSGIFEKLSDISKSKNKIIVYGFPELFGDKIYNSAQIIFPDKNFNKIYRKTHLFYNEINCFDFGDLGFFNIYYPPFDLNLGTMICYDWRFPEAARTLGLLGSDLIVCPSNLVTNIWTKVVPARAIENKVYFAVANRTGNETVDNEELIFNGLSGIYSYYGDLLADADAYKEILIIAEIEPQNTRNKSFNKFNDIFKDRREPFYFK